MPRERRTKKVVAGNDEYQVLNDMVSELKAQALNVPASVQDYLGATLSNAYQTAYSGYAARHPGTAPMEVFFGPNSPDPAGALGIRRQIAAQPADFGFLTKSAVKIGDKYQPFAQAFPDVNAALSGVNTLRDVQNVLYRGNLSGFLEAAVNNVKSSPQDFAASVSALSAGFVEKLPFFNRSKGTFVNYAQWNAFSEAKNYMRSERDAAAMRGSSIEAMSSGETETFDPFAGAQAVVNTGTETAPLNPFPNGAPWVEVLPRSLVQRMEDAYGKSFARWHPFEIDPNSVGAKAGITPQQVYRSLGMLSDQRVADLADYIEAGGTLNVLDFNAVGEYNLQGSYTPVPAREIARAPWYPGLVEKMEPGSTGITGRLAPYYQQSRYPTNLWGLHGKAQLDPSGFNSGRVVGPLSTTEKPGLEPVSVTAQDVINYGRIKSMIGPLPYDQQQAVNTFGRALSGIKRSISQTDASIPEEYGAAELFNDYVMSLTPEQAGRALPGQATTVPYLEARYVSHYPITKDLGHGAELRTNRTARTSYTTSYEYRQWVQSQKYDQDTAPQMPVLQGGTRSLGSYGGWLPLDQESGADPDPMAGDNSLSLAADAQSLDEQYMDLVLSIPEYEDTPAIVMRKIMGGGSDWDEEDYEANNAASFGVMQTIFPHPKQRPDHQAATVTAREQALLTRLNELKAIDPNAAYRASYVGKDPKAFRASLQQLVEHYGIKGIDYTEGQEEKFARDYYNLAKTNPEAAQLVASLFPDQAEKMQAAVDALKQARKNRAQATPAPARTAYTNAGESFVAPDTNNPLTRSVRAYSPGQSRRLRGDDLVDPTGQGLDLPVMASGSGGSGNGSGNGSTPPPPPDFSDDWQNYDENGNYIPPAQNNGGNTPTPVRQAAPTGAAYNPNDPNEPAPTNGPARRIDPFHIAPERQAEINRLRARTEREIYGDPGERRGQRVNGALDTAPLASAWNRLNAIGNRMPMNNSPLDRDLANYNNPLYGQGRVVQDAAGNVTDRSVRIDDWVTMSNSDVMSAYGAVQGTVAEALGAPMPSDPTDAMATIKQRLWSGLKKHVDEIVKGLEKTGMDPTEASEYGKRFQNLADHIAERSFKTAEGIVKTATRSATGVEVNDDAVSVVKQGALRMTDPQAIRAMMSRNPQMEAAIRSSGLTPEQLASLPAGQEMIMSSEGSSYLFGGSFGGGGFNRNAQGGLMGMMGNSSIGRLAYGAYMFNRMWQMAAGPVMETAAQYGTFMGSVGALTGDSAMGTDAGFGVRQSMAQLYQGRTAYQTFGAFMDIPYQLSQSDDAFGRLYASGRVASGLAVGGVVAGAMAGMLPASMAGIASVASALPTVGLVAGGLMLAGTAGMEIYNAATGSDVTYSSLFRDYQKGNFREKARQSAAMAVDPAAYKASSDVYQRYASVLVPGGTIDPAMNFGLGRSEAAKAITGDLTDEQLAEYLPPQEAYTLGYQNVTPEQQQMIDAAYKVAMETGESPEAAMEGLAALKRVLGRNPTTDEAAQFAKKAKSSGYSWNRYANQAASYGEQMGFVPETPDMEQAVMGYLGASPRQKYGMNLQAQRVNAYAGMIGNYTQSATIPHEIARTFANPGQATNAQRILSAYSSVYGSASDGTALFLSDIGKTASPLAGNMISNFLQNAGTFGMNEGRAGYYASMMANATPQQTLYMNAVMGGDLRGMAYMQQAWGLNGLAPLYDLSGNSMLEVSGAGVVAAMNSWSGITGMPGVSAQQILGTSNQGIIDAWTQGGSRGLQDFAAQKSYEASMASAGIALRGVALSEQFYWGSGSWDKPGAGSMSALEDQMIALQNRSQMADFAMQEKRMGMANDYAIRRENLDYQRMNLSQNYNLWQADFGYQQTLQQRGWTMQDWQYQDTKRGLSFQWNMEDINEAIRYSTGRDRRQLMKQRDRMAVTENLDSDQIETERGRQKEAWAAEDERYKKNREYTLQMAEIEKENFNLNKKQREELYKLDQEDFKRRKEEYEEEKKLREEMQELQRKYQADQLALQKESAGLHAYQAQLQKEIADAQKNSERAWSDFLGKIQNMNSYDKLPVIMQSIMQMFGAANTVDTRKISSVKDLFNTISGFDMKQLKALEQYWEETGQ